MGEANATAYMLQLSDGSLRNGLISEEEVGFALRMNLLFFDEIHASAPAVLRNHALFNMANDRNERGALKKAYCKHIRPLLLGENHDIDDVASSIVAADKPIGLSNRTTSRVDLELIKRHAEFIGDAAPKYVSSEISRESFLELCLTSTEYYLRHLECSDHSDALKDFALWLPRRGASDLKVADVYSRAEERYSGESSRLIKAMAFIGMEYLSAPTSRDEFSVGGKAISLAANIQRANFGCSEAGSADASPTEIPSDVQFDFPVKRVLSLGLSEILELREVGPFPRMRQQLKELRSGTPGDLSSECAAILGETRDELVRFISWDDEKRRGRILNELRKHDQKLRIRRLGSTGIALATSIGMEVAAKKLEFPAPDYVCGLITFMSKFSYDWKLSRLEASYSPSMNLGNPTAAGSSEDKMFYGPVDGSTHL